MNHLTETAFRRLERMHAAIEFQIHPNPEREFEGQSILYFCLPRWYPSPPGDFFKILPWMDPKNRGGDWLVTTVPDLWLMGYRAADAARRLAWFETDRRATTLVLALEAFRLDHGELPESLSELADGYLDAVPPDPYSGRQFVYFPTGIAVSGPEIERYTSEMKSYEESSTRLQLRFDPDRSPPVNPNIPAIWSTGPDIAAAVVARTAYNESTHEKVPEEKWLVEYQLRPGMDHYDYYLPLWMYGDWFGIPTRQ